MDSVAASSRGAKALATAAGAGTANRESSPGPILRDEHRPPRRQALPPYKPRVIQPKMSSRIGGPEAASKVRHSYEKISSPGIRSFRAGGLCTSASEGGGRSGYFVWTWVLLPCLSGLLRLLSLLLWRSLLVPSLLLPAVSELVLAALSSLAPLELRLSRRSDALSRATRPRWNLGPTARFAQDR